MRIEQIDTALMKDLFEQAWLHLDQEKELINGLNVFPVPDGDTGTNMSLTMKTPIEMLKKGDPKTPAEVAQIVARGALMGARGNSGVILSQILGGFSKGIEQAEHLDVSAFVGGLQQAVQTSYKAVMKPVEGTMLTVIRQTAEGMGELDLEGLDFLGFFEELLKRANQSLAATPELLPILKQSGVVDAGGRGLISIFQGMFRALKGEKMEAVVIQPVEVKESWHQSATDIEFLYCTEFIIARRQGDSASLKRRIESLGDSVVFVESEDIVKVHLHTNHPGDALEAALKLGELQNIKIDNMKSQHETILGVHHPQPLKIEKEVGLVVISAGEGFSQIFKDFGVDEIVMGGQTMNPSTEDIVAAIEKVPAKKVLVLPNNSNILLAAKQAKEVLEEKEVRVIESKTLPQGVSALMAFDSEVSLDDNEKVMNESLQEVSTLLITYSVRTTKLGGFAIKENDIMGILDGKIVAVDKTPEKVLRKVLLEQAPNYELITVYTGEQHDSSKVQRIMTELEKKYRDTDFEVYEGGQPVYNYIVSLE